MAAKPNLVKAIGNRVSTELNAPMTDSALSLTVADPTNASSAGGVVVIDYGITGKEEYVYVNAVSSNTFTVANDGRGLYGSAAVAHDQGATVYDIGVAAHINNLITAVLVEHDDGGKHTTIDSALVTSGNDVTSSNKAVDNHVDNFLNDAIVSANNLLLTSSVVIDSGGWVERQTLSPAYQAATTIRISSQDVTHLFPKGTKLRLKQGGSYKYFYVTASAFSTHTDLTITGGTDYTLTNAAITDFAIAYGVANGFPEWFTVATPTYGAGGSMTFTSVTTYSNKLRLVGNTATYTLYAVGATGGTASNEITATLPISASLAASSITPGAATVTEGTQVAGVSYISASSPTIVRVRRYDSANFGLGASRAISCSISYTI